jgi:STE24 endopeptidase
MIAQGRRTTGKLLRVCFVWLWFGLLLAAAPKAPPVPPGAVASDHFDPETATKAWLATVPPVQRARSDAYFEGGYWLILWNFLSTVGVAFLLLATRVSARMRDLAGRLTHMRWLQSFAYWIEYITVSAVLLFPLTVYEDFFREHQYGLSNQSFGGWFRDAFIGLVLAWVGGGVAFAVFMAAVRRFPRTWHWWGTGVVTGFVVLTTLIFPVFVAPLFNTYTPLPDSKLKQQILSMARANGIPAKDVYEVNASRQSKRVSANVSGLFGTERITLNDNLLNRCSPEAVVATMEHEMGHYVMHHILNGILFSVIVIAIGLAILHWTLRETLHRWGTKWDVRGVDDVAGLPLAVILLATMSFLFLPIGNTFTRTQEYEADIFGLNASRQPDGEAEVDLLLGEYRKLDPGPVEEWIFFDHPSGRSRIYAAMRWKAENLCLFDARLACETGSGRKPGLPAEDRKGGITLDVQHNER